MSEVRYSVMVYATVEDGAVTRVVVDDENITLIGGDDEKAVEIAEKRDMARMGVRLVTDLRVTIRTRWGDLRGVLRDVEDPYMVLNDLSAATTQLDDERAIAVASIVEPGDDYHMPWEERPDHVALIGPTPAYACFCGRTLTLEPDQMLECCRRNWNHNGRG